MLVFDTETTGLLKPSLCQLHLQPFITEIYICKFDSEFKIIDEFETYLKPPVPVPEEITKITGITNEMLYDAPKFIEIYDDLCEFFLGEHTIFAHNCSFDIGMICIELQRHDLENKFPWPKNQICTVEAAFPIKNKRISNSELYKMATGKELENAHRAKEDTIALIESIKFLMREGLINGNG